MSYLEIILKKILGRYTTEDVSGDLLRVFLGNNLEASQDSVTVPGVEHLITGGSAQNTVNRVGAIASGATEILIDIQDPVVLDVLDFATNDPTNGRFEIWGRDKTSTLIPFRIVSSDAGITPGITPAVLMRRPESKFGPFSYLGKWAEGTSHYITLTKQMYFPNGVRVLVKNNASTDINISCNLWYRNLN